jgi:hypothetical protein
MLWILGAVAVGTALLGAFFLGVFAGSGELEVLVHDAPCADCAHVYVTFSSVSVHQSDYHGNGWMTLAVRGTTFDLEALNGTAMARLLGLDNLTAGSYTQVRLAVTNVTIVLLDGQRMAAQLSSSTSADINVPFTVSAGGTTILDIDIDLASSVHVTPTGAVFTPDIGSVTVSSS